KRERYEPTVSIPENALFTCVAVKRYEPGWAGFASFAERVNVRASDPGPRTSHMSPLYGGTTTVTRRPWRSALTGLPASWTEPAANCFGIFTADGNVTTRAPAPAQPHCIS